MDDARTRQRAARQAVVEALAPATQHAANNMLQVLDGTAYILKRVAKDEAETKRAERIATATERLEHLIRAFLVLARRPVPDTAPLDVGALLGRLALLAELFVPKETTIEIAAAAGLQRAGTDASLLDAPLLDLLRGCAGRLAPVLRIAAEPAPAGVLLTIEGLPGDAPVEVMAEGLAGAGCTVQALRPTLALLLPPAA